MNATATADKKARKRTPHWLETDPDWLAVGGLSIPSKMPGFAYGLPAHECHTGSKLREVKGSTCEKCYAYKRGNYLYKNVIAAQYRRLDTVLGDLEAWTAAMIRLIPKARMTRTAPEPTEFRWHDSGDIQSRAHFEAIIAIAEALPTIRFWIPTREYGMVLGYLKETRRNFPGNLTVRMSAPMMGREPSLSPEYHALGLRTSTVAANVGFHCGALERGGECGPCRACWDKDVDNSDYPSH